MYQYNIESSNKVWALNYAEICTTIYNRIQHLSNVLLSDIQNKALVIPKRLIEIIYSAIAHQKLEQERRMKKGGRNPTKQQNPSLLVNMNKSA